MLICIPTHRHNLRWSYLRLGSRRAQLPSLVVVQIISLRVIPESATLLDRETENRDNMDHKLFTSCYQEIIDKDHFLHFAFLHLAPLFRSSHRAAAITKLSLHNALGIYRQLYDYSQYVTVRKQTFTEQRVIDYLLSYLICDRSSQKQNK
jgi:hypothetical protein